MKIQKVPERVVERVLTKVAMGPVVDLELGACHLSTYSTASHGYAQVGWAEDGERRMVLCHQVVWIDDEGPIPDGVTVDHRCHVRRCIRRPHLRLLTNKENGARNRPGFDWPLDGSCSRGHGPEHRAERSDGGTRCMVCHAEDKAAHAAKPESKKRKADWQRERRRTRSQPTA